jgi:hypothetical protein
MSAMEFENENGRFGSIYHFYASALIATSLTSDPIILQMNLDSSVSEVLLRVETRVAPETVACLQMAVLTVGELNACLHFDTLPRS